MIFNIRTLQVLYNLFSQVLSSNLMSWNCYKSRWDIKSVLVFFQLRLPNSSCSEDVHFMFFEWIESLGCHVHDLSNPDEDESINADPEGWVQEVLSHPNIKVVVIEGVGHSSAEAKELSGRCSMDQSAGPSSTCTATSSLTGSATSSVDGR